MPNIFERREDSPVVLSISETSASNQLSKSDVGVWYYYPGTLL